MSEGGASETPTPISTMIEEDPSKRHKVVFAKQFINLNLSSVFIL